MSTNARGLSRFSKAEVDLAFKNAKRVFYHPGLVILVAPKQRETARVLSIISKKAGSSPQRNTARRRIRAIFYQERFFEEPFDYLVLFKKEGVALSFQELHHALCQARERSQRYKS